MDFLSLDVPEYGLQLSRVSSFQYENPTSSAFDFFSGFDSIETTKTSSQNYVVNYSTPIVDYSNSNHCTCNCKSMMHQGTELFTGLSRQSSTGSRSGFRLHKDASEEDARELYMALAPESERQLISILDKAETNSRSTTADSTPQTPPMKPTLSEVAASMVENHHLNVAKYGELSDFDKHYLLNILFIKNKSTVDLSLSSEDFVVAVNQAIGSAKEKRNDDRLRFIYKRAIKYLLAKRSDYTANKLHKMDDFKDPMVQYYFPANPEITAEIMDTSFASKKKILKFFKMSPAFKKDFLEFANSELKTLYNRYSRETYQNMHKHLVLRYQKKECNKVSPDILMKAFKRLPWRCADIQSTIDQITLINLL